MRNEPRGDQFENLRRLAQTLEVVRSPAGRGRSRAARVPARPDALHSTDEPAFHGRSRRVHRARRSARRATSAPTWSRKAWCSIAW
jgi:hypothetical protein